MLALQANLQEYLANAKLPSVRGAENSVHSTLCSVVTNGETCAACMRLAVDGHLSRKAEAAQARLAEAKLGATQFRNSSPDLVSRCEVLCRLAAYQRSLAEAQAARRTLDGLLVASDRALSDLQRRVSEGAASVSPLAGKLDKLERSGKAPVPLP
jgi:hypothetical protein